jgi:hypothetical protein
MYNSIPFTLVTANSINLTQLGGGGGGSLFQAGGVGITGAGGNGGPAVALIIAY